MFKTKPDATFTDTVMIPNGDSPLPLKLRFKRKSKTEVADWIAGSAKQGDLDTLAEVVECWIDADTPYSVVALGEVLEAYTGAGMAIFAGYIRALSEAERKN